MKQEIKVMLYINLLATVEHARLDKKTSSRDEKGEILEKY